MNNNNKVAEKVIWEDSISPDNEASLASSQPQMQTQPQMTFCYKCNNVIPGNSKFCPYCQTELYVVCPKCGEKYSSQYPSCSQCGTNRKEYLELQRREQERKMAAERERQRYQEKLERERQAKELQERLKVYEQKEKEKQEKENYRIKNEEIKKTKEYELIYSMFCELFKTYDKKIENIFLVSGLITSFFSLLFINKDIELFFTIFGVSIVMAIIEIIVYCIFKSNSIRNKFLLKYILKRNDYNKEIITHDIIKMVIYQGWERLSDCCIIAYRKAKGLPVKYEWHSLR